jgi:GTP-binding protein EngB required for normal cell division
MEPIESRTTNLEEGAPPLNEAQRRALVTRWQEIDRLMAEVETVLSAETSKSAFPKFKTGLSPVQIRVVGDYIAGVRRELLQFANAFNVELPTAQLASLHAVRVDLMFAEIAAEECAPERMRGYGELRDETVPQLRGMVEQLKSSLQKMMTCLSQNGDFAERLNRLGRTGDEIDLLRMVTEIVDRRGMVEFRPTIDAIIDRLNTKTFEIAIFGRVSSGKSSLLNQVLGTHALPVGVTPVTAVPTRLVFGAEPAVSVWFATGGRERVAINRLEEFAGEQYNRGNEKRVARLVVELPAPRLIDGIVFVDTPGLGSLATVGAAETLAYLPRCDFGVLLVDSASTLTEDDLGTWRMLLEAGIPSCVLLSKADLISQHEREFVIAYTREKVRERLGVDLAIRPVSVSPDEQGLVDAWFGEDIAPLYERHQALSEASIRRKVGVLRESVTAALRSLLKRNRDPAEPTNDEVRRAALRLREATGEFDAVSRKCCEVIDRVRGSTGRLIDHAARAAAVERETHANRQSGWSASILQRLAAESVRDLPGMVVDLARKTAGALIECAQSMRASDVPRPDEFTGFVQNMPLLDVSGIQASVRVGVLASAWRRGAERSIQRTLQQQIGPELTRKISVWSSLLQDWLRSTLQSIRERFDAYAESYRAAIALVEASGQEQTHETASQIERDLEQLRASQEESIPA